MSIVCGSCPQEWPVLESNDYVLCAANSTPCVQGNIRLLNWASESFEAHAQPSVSSESVYSSCLDR